MIYGDHLYLQLGWCFGYIQYSYKYVSFRRLGCILERENCTQWKIASWHWLAFIGGVESIMKSLFGTYELNTDQQREHCTYRDMQWSCIV